MSLDRKKKLFDAITDIRDDLIEQAQETATKPPRPRWQLWGVAAACCMLVAGLAFGIWRSLPLPGGIGGCSGGPSYYAGPVFPLTLTETTPSISAKRHLTYEFAQPPGDNRLHFWGAHVQDSYILSNRSEQEQQVTALYPFVGNFDELDMLTPDIRVNGAPVRPTLHFGSTGSFTEGTDDVNYSLLEPGGWEDFKTLLEDGTYQKNTFAPAPRLDQRVTVYEFSNSRAPLEEYPAATQAISFTIDPSRTVILLFGINGGEFGDDGFRRYSYFVPGDGAMLPEAKMLIVMGEDIGEYTLQGYKNGACEKGNELENVHAAITRYESVLSNIVDRLVAEIFTCYRDGAGLPAGVSHEMYCDAVAQQLHQNGTLTGSPDGRYMGELDSIITDTNVLRRLFYLEFTLVIPPGEDISVEAGLRKNPSYEFPHKGSKRPGVQGYDLVTRLGSNLHFEQLTAEIAEHEGMEILEQNFGFDLPDGISRVELDPEREHYYLELRPAGAGP